MSQFQPVFDSKWIELYKYATTTYGDPGMGDEVYWALQFLSDRFPNGGNGMIEIGSAGGVSFHCWSQIFHAPRISVDMPSGGWGGDSERRLKRWKDQLGEDELYSVLGDSRSSITISTVERILDGRQVDWLFIDADHEYDAAWADYRNYKSFVRSGGFIGFHDVSSAWASEKCGKAWREIKSEYPLERSWQTDWDCAGIGIVQVE